MRIGNSDHVICELGELGQAVQEVLKEYPDEARTAADESVTEVARESRKIIKAKAPRGRRKKYFKSFRTRTENSTFGREVTIYSGNHEYSLTHLLEKGHFLWNRPNRPTRAFRHWKDGEQYAIETLPKRIKEKLGG